MHSYSFRVVAQSDHKLLEKIYRLRYQVYCHECGFIKPEDHPKGLESDLYDPHSVHIVALDSKEEIVGTMRMILNHRYPLPIDQLCPELDYVEKKTPQFKTCEISRFIIRRKLDRQEQYGYHALAKHIFYGMCRHLYAQSVKRNMTHLLALMEKRLGHLLKLYGIHISSIGEEVDYYGPVLPYVICLERSRGAILNYHLLRNIPLDDERIFFDKSSDIFAKS